GADGCSPALGTVTNNCTPQSRGDNWALIGSPEITVMKGLDIKPMLSTLQITALTSTASREGRGGVSIAAGGPFAPMAAVNSQGSPGVAGADGAGTGVHEKRHTLRIDAQGGSGAWCVGSAGCAPFW